MQEMTVFSCGILDEIRKDETIFTKLEDAGLTEKDILFIKALVNGKPNETLRPPEKNFLYEIVNNQYNGIDVKLWDYLENDLDSIKDKHSSHQIDDFEWTPDCSKLLGTARVMNVKDHDGKKRSHIVYHHKAITDIHRLYQIKEMMHQRVYQHTDVNGAEIMLSDFLQQIKKIANSVFDFSTFQNLHDAEALEELKKLRSEWHQNDPKKKRLESLIKKLEPTKQPQQDCVDPFYQCFATHDVTIKKIKMDDMMRDLKKRLKDKIMAEEDVVVDVVEFREEFNPSKVWLYNNKYSSFPMSSADSHFYRRADHYEDIKSKEKRAVPYYDSEYDEWFSSKESFRNDCLKLMESTEYITCSVRLYCKGDPSRFKNSADWTKKDEDVEQRYIYLNKKWKQFQDQFCEELNQENNDSVTWLEQQCDAFILEDRVRSTYNRAVFCTAIGLPAALLSRVLSQILIGPLLTLVAGAGCLWIYDQTQMNQQRYQRKLRNSEIKYFTGAAFVLSAVAIGTIPNPKATAYRPFKTVQTTCGTNCNRIISLMTKAQNVLRCITGRKFITVNIRVGRLGLGAVSAAVSTAYVGLAEGLFPSFNYFTANDPHYSK